MRSGGPARPDALTVVTWNVEWAPEEKRTPIKERLAALEADLIVLTEGDRGILPGGGFALDGGLDWGYVSPDAARRKVILWSRFPLLDPIETPAGMPPGRFVAATVETGAGPIRFLGVCIPWFDAHVRTGRKDAERWDEHVSYLTGLRALAQDASREMPTCVLGDFNQRIPKSRHCPEDVHEALLIALEGFRVATKGDVPGLSEPSIDHVAVSAGLDAIDVRGIDRHADGDQALELSDHDLLVGRVRCLRGSNREEGSVLSSTLTEGRN